MFPTLAEERIRVVRLCVDFLGGSWTEVNFDDIYCKRLATGFGNKSYHCSIKNCNESKRKFGEHDEVIVRLFESDCYSKCWMKLSGEMAEPMIFERLTQVGFAPKILGVFNKGIIVEYVANTNATVEDLSSLELCKAVFRKMALFNSQKSMPISKNPMHLFDKIEQAANMPMNKQILKLYAPEEECDLNLIFDFDAIEELKWLRKVVPKFGNRIVLSHSDMNINNVLLRTKYTSIDDRVLLIDYETAVYFYRGFDIAQFLRYKCLRISFDGVKLHMTFTETDQNTKRALLEEYLLEFKKLNEKDVNPKYDNLEILQMEVSFFELVFDMFLLSFFRLTINESKIKQPINVPLEIALNYKLRKDAVLKTYGHVM